MANQWSDWYANTTYGLAVVSPTVKVPVGVDNRYRKRSTILLGLVSGGTPAAFTIADIARMCRVKSTDRINAIYGSAAGGTAVAADLGFYLAGSAADGAVVDVDRFASATTLAGTVARTELFVESTNLVHVDRGKTVWELLGLSADSGVSYDICFTATATLTTADARVVLEVEGYFT